MMKKIISIGIRYRVILITLAIFGLFGYTLYRIQQISNPRVDQSYIEAKRGTQPTSTKLKIKDSVKTQIEQLQETPINTQPGQLGTSDPFNP